MGFWSCQRTSTNEYPQYVQFSLKKHLTSTPPHAHPLYIVFLNCKPQCAMKKLAISFGHQSRLGGSQFSILTAPTRVIQLDKVLIPFGRHRLTSSTHVSTSNCLAEMRKAIHAFCEYAQHMTRLNLFRLGVPK